MLPLFQAPERMFKSAAGLLFVASMLLYCSALACPGFYVIAGNEPPKPWINGFWLLVLGAGAVPQGVLAWLANPALLASWLFALWRKPVLALVLSVLALGLVLDFLGQQGSAIHDGSSLNTLGGPALGYWLWLASIATTLLAAATQWQRSRQPSIPR